MTPYVSDGKDFHVTQPVPGRRRPHKIEECHELVDEGYPGSARKVAVVTGANGGLRLASAKELAGHGAHVVMAVRNQAKAADARQEILAAHPQASLEIVELDLGSLASVKAAAEAIAATHDRIDILMCNAGVMAMPQGTTVDGFDTQMGINVLGHWALIASAAHRGRDAWCASGDPVEHRPAHGSCDQPC